MRIFVAQLLCLILSSQLVLISAVQANPFVQTHTAPVSSLPANNLSNTQGAVANGSLIIHLGGSTHNVHPNDLLTPAEQIAVSQVLQTGHQSVVLDKAGDAIGGLINLNAVNASSLVIPHHVTAVFDAAHGSTLSIGGDLTNFGSLYVISTAANVHSATISALNIQNEIGGLISSRPGTFPALGLTSAAPSLDLTLAATNHIMNAGTIVSSGNLALTAGGGITNALPTGTVGPRPIIQAAEQISILSGIGNIANAGLIESLNSNININSALATNLNIDNTNGLIRAEAGNLNIRDSSFTGKFDVNFNGGDVVARALNLNSGSGNVAANLNSVSGVVNVNAGTAHVVTNSGNLLLGQLNLSGDPTFYNTSGDVVLTNSINTNGGPLAIVAYGSILSGSGSGNINTRGSANGGDVLMIAGASFTVDSSGNLSVTAPSSTGGSIDLTQGNTVKNINTSGNFFAAGNGGNVTLIAFANSGGSGGSITLPSSGTINTRAGFGGSVDGNITIYAGATSGSGISIGSLRANSGTATSGGNIDVQTTAPQIGSGLSISSTGALTSGSISPSSTLGAASVSFNTLRTDVGNITVKSGAEVSGTGGVITNAGTATNAGSTITLVSSSSSDFTIGAGGTPTNGIAGNIRDTAGSTGAGGTISITNNGSGGINYSTIGAITISTTNGNGGSIALTAPNGTVTLGSGNISLNAAGSSNGNGGTFAVNAGNLAVKGSGLTINANAVGNGSGDSTTGVSLLSSGSITFPNNGRLVLTSTGSGTGSGNGGLVDVVAGSGSLAVGTGSGQISATATSGGASGNGGTVIFSAAQNLTVNPTGLSFGPQGTGGNGGSLTLNAGTAGPGALQVSGSLYANGTGNGAGGNINLSYNDPSNAFVVGSTVSNSGVAGSISATSVSTAAGGNVSISNNAAAPLTVSLTGNITASSSGGTNGTLTFNEPGQAVSVSGAGGLTGFVTSNGSSVNIKPGAGNLTTASITATAGSATLWAPFGNVSMNNNVSATGALTVTSNTTSSSSVTLASGMTASGSSVSLNSSNINNNGTISATGGDLTIQSNALPATLKVTQGAGAALTATGNVLFNPTTAGAITVTGSTSAISAGNTVNFNGGTSAVSASVQSITGTVLASGSSVSITTTSGDLTTGLISSSAGATTITASGGNVATTNNISASGGNLSITTGSGSSNWLSVASGKTLSAPGVTLTTPTLILNGTVTATSSNLSVQSNGPSAALTVLAASGSGLNATGTGANVQFNPTTAGSINLNGGVNNYGSYAAANTVSLNGGSSGSVIINANSFTGAVSGTAGSWNATVANGNVNAGSTTVSGGGNYWWRVNNGNLTLGTVNDTSGDVELYPSGNTTLSGAINADRIYIQPTGSTSTVTAANNITATTELGINALGGVTVNAGYAMSSASHLAITTTHLTDNGRIYTSGSNTLEIATPTSIVFDGTPSTTTSGGAILIRNSGGGAITFNSSYTFSPSSGMVSISSPNSGGSVNLAANVTVQSGTAHIELEAPSLSLATGAKLSSAGNGSIISSSITNNGTISATGNLQITSGTLATITGTGSLSGSTKVEIDSPNSAVSITQNQITGTLVGTAATSYTASITSGPLNIGNVRALNGNLSITLGSGQLQVMSGSNLTADNGNILLQNNGGSGSTTVINSSYIAATSATAGSGQIDIVFGAVPSSPVAGVAPSGFTANLLNGGAIYYGANGFTNISANMATINASMIIFNTGSLSSSAIQLNGGVTLDATSYDPAAGTSDPTQLAEARQKSDCMPVAFVQPAATLGRRAEPELKVQPLSNGQAWYQTPSAVRQLSDGTISLADGEYLLSVGERAVVHLDGIVITIPAHSAVLVSKQPDATKVRNLSCATVAPVTVETADGHQVHALVGDEVSVLAVGNSPMTALQKDEIARRRLHVSSLSNGAAISSCEVSPLSLMKQVVLIDKMRKSADKSTQRAVESLLRAAACLQLTTRGHGPYSKL